MKITDETVPLVTYVGGERLILGQVKFMTNNVLDVRLTLDDRPDEADYIREKLLEFNNGPIDRTLDVARDGTLEVVFVYKRPVKKVKKVVVTLNVEVNDGDERATEIMALLNETMYRVNRRISGSVSMSTGMSTYEIEVDEEEDEEATDVKAV